jgi:hypothetical protein
MLRSAAPPQTKYPIDIPKVLSEVNLQFPGIEEDNSHGRLTSQVVVGNCDLSERAEDEQLYEICSLPRKAVMYPVLSQAMEQSGPITASTGPSSSILVSAAPA